MERGIPEEWREKYLPSGSSWGKGTVIITTKNRNEVPRLDPFTKYLYFNLFVTLYYITYSELHLNGMDKEEASELLTKGFKIDFGRDNLSEMMKVSKGKPLLLARYIFICSMHNILIVLPSNASKSS